ncbi:MAG: cytochrome C [Bacteroidetes bacterium]|nr:cytochrome C [Bacteroidota bacterium]
MKKIVYVFIIFSFSVYLIGCSNDNDPKPSNKKEYAGTYQTISQIKASKFGCLSCHEGIETVRENNSLMMQMIKGIGASTGDPNGCIVCHGGTPNATTYKEAHSGSPESLKKIDGPKEFYPDPGSMWINKYTCGQSACHPKYPDRLNKSLMNTEAGKISGNLHSWGIEEVQYYRVPWGNYDVKDSDGPEPVVGTKAYKKYMHTLINKYPKQFPKELKQIPNPSVDEIEKDPKLAGFTYQRQQCQRCHVGVRGREKRGDYRGMGCSACHTLYSNEGYYEGNDPTIDKSEHGHMLTHRMRGTREAGYGIPVETCNSCHNRGKRIGVTYQGLMEFSYGTPFDSAGTKQPKLHTKTYLFISDDLHHQIESRPGNPKGGLLCQDCHTTIDMHGDGNIFGTTLAQVEIECQDCHGTPDKYPWELPLGFSEEFNRKLNNIPRGLAQEPLRETSYFGTNYKKEDGYLLTTRGNPFGNVVKKDDKVILHSATGNDFFIPVLKTIKIKNTWKSEQALVAMSSVKKHNQKLECYACHSSWVPQCYGCHVVVDYSKNKDGKPSMDIDWIASGSRNYPDGQTAESRLGTGGIKSPGKVYESRSYLRWEEPVLGINGEGRVTPLMPGCQVVFTVIGRDGQVLVKNKIARSLDEAKSLKQKEIPLALDMAPVQPHSAQRIARTCESCHNNPKALGYGISGGVFQNKYNENIIEDLVDAKTGKPIPKKYKIQIQAIPGLNFDWSQIVNKKGIQLATVGTHWPLSRALNNEERSAMDRSLLCRGCHIEMKNSKLWNKVSTPGSLTDEEHIALMNKVLKSYYKSLK